MALDIDSRTWLQNHFKENVCFDEPMARHTSLRIGGPADALVTPATIDDLQTLVQWASQRRLSVLVVGDGTNLLVKDAGIDGIVIRLNRCLNQISKTVDSGGRTFVRAMAGVRLHKLCTFALAAQLKGMNFALGIPGTVGGAIMMNAGTFYGSMAGVLEEISILASDGNIQSIPKENLDFSYRQLTLKNNAIRSFAGNPIILEGLFDLQPAQEKQLQQEAEEILKKRRESQPTHLPSAGCFFKNPASDQSAGELIDRTGLKGEKIGGALVSPRHANFIINTGDASASDVLTLMETVQAAVLKRFNIKLEAEVRIVGR